MVRAFMEYHVRSNKAFDDGVLIRLDTSMSSHSRYNKDMDISYFVSRHHMK